MARMRLQHFMNFGPAPEARLTDAQRRGNRENLSEMDRTPDRRTRFAKPAWVFASGTSGLALAFLVGIGAASAILAACAAFVAAAGACLLLFSARTFR